MGERLKANWKLVKLGVQRSINVHFVGGNTEGFLGSRGRLWPSNIGTNEQNNIQKKSTVVTQKGRHCVCIHILGSFYILWLLVLSCIY